MMNYCATLQWVPWFRTTEIHLGQTSCGSANPSRKENENTQPIQNPYITQFPTGLPRHLSAEIQTSTAHRSSPLTVLPNGNLVYLTWLLFLHSSCSILKTKTACIDHPLATFTLPFTFSVHSALTEPLRTISLTVTDTRSGLTDWSGLTLLHIWFRT